MTEPMRAPSEYSSRLCFCANEAQSFTWTRRISREEWDQYTTLSTSRKSKDHLHQQYAQAIPSSIPLPLFLVLENMDSIYESVFFHTATPVLDKYLIS